MKNMRSVIWHHSANSSDGAEYIGREISTEINAKDGFPTLLLLSGGSCLSVLPHIKDVSFNGVTAVVLDERFDQTNENNNFSQIENLPWSGYFLENGGTFISTKVLEADTQQSLAERFEVQIENWITKNPNGRMIALFGMGSDGHTAGIFPFPENKKLFEDMFDGKSMIASYDANGKNKFSKRITTTNILFGRIDSGFAYIFGDDKKAALDDFRKGVKEANELPVSFLKNVKKIKIVTDIK